jgi:hypothetical protein
MARLTVSYPKIAEYMKNGLTFEETCKEVGIEATKVYDKFDDRTLVKRKIQKMFTTLEVYREFETRYSSFNVIKGKIAQHLERKYLIRRSETKVHILPLIRKIVENQKETVEA